MFKGKGTRAILDTTGESVSFGLDFSGDAEADLSSFVGAQRLTLGRHQFLGGSSRKGPFMVIAELLI